MILSRPLNTRFNQLVCSGTPLRSYELARYGLTVDDAQNVLMCRLCTEQSRY
jgi:hypothetical protein